VARNGPSGGALTPLSFLGNLIQKIPRNSDTNKAAFPLIYIYAFYNQEISQETECKTKDTFIIGYIIPTTHIVAKDISLNTHLKVINI
jgi:hypothetical protein